MEGTNQWAQQAIRDAQQALRRDVARAEGRAGKPCRECAGTRRVQAWDADAGQFVEAECGECLHASEG
jgi:hypothetical protein